MVVEVSIVEDMTGPFGPEIAYSSVDIHWPTPSSPSSVLGDYAGLGISLTDGTWDLFISTMRVATPPPFDPDAPLQRATFYDILDGYYVIIDFNGADVTSADFMDGFSTAEFEALDPVINGMPLTVPGGGTAGADRLRGTAEADELYGLGGNDKIRGLGGNDTLSGDDGRDKLYGGNGRDELYGGNGRDALVGGKGNDTLDGGNGNDRLNGGAGNDLMMDSKGNDTMRGGAGEDIFLFNERVSRRGNEEILDFNTDDDTIRVELRAAGGFSKGDVITGEALEDLVSDLGVDVDFQSDRVVISNRGNSLTAQIDGIVSQEAFWDAFEYVFI